MPNMKLMGKLMKAKLIVTEALRQSREAHKAKLANLNCFCDCGESFELPVTHCQNCDHHWPEVETICRNCYESL